MRPRMGFEEGQGVPSTRTHDIQLGELQAVGPVFGPNAGETPISDHGRGRMESEWCLWNGAHDRPGAGGNRWTADLEPCCCVCRPRF